MPSPKPLTHRPPRHFRLPTQEATESLARALAGTARPGDCWALSGEMGSGKSTFARAFLRALTQNSALEVPSPTFSLVQPYETPVGPAYHYDLWRLEGPESLAELAWDEACAGLMLVEWPERAEDCLPPDAVQLIFSIPVPEKASGLKDSGEVETQMREVTVRNWPPERAFPEVAGLSGAALS
ncbi:tRNA (adenosine(37)-N6)-threonylcarbamoyltransferase complex ATPase subunit type 1 TsaE [Oecophyllibacter saccharovorans]|uniref:tRNA threonylcarbamoyladenosine biosynthesis protein TsaE n=1 Tax=Oecophyllibacter saccharovorans TaxID=2558360 RepID=A0A506ULP1_9PROT|nr:tRNA (adenosine(37)-N6)-threonylcarbamoyltransferase complex ATPase subunit type 1 TsaE [Oecophyllibacter saccharovorans]TPW34240.1 tRNA (adenosine(37)-N6)-threonylcarbamoyltransferase complex ATPase subunit type 1 TsaE [Oecophyllibacter saccharovorans]